MKNFWKGFAVIATGFGIGAGIQGIRAWKLKKEIKDLDTKTSELDIRLDEDRKIAAILGIELPDELKES